jgi:ribosomal protein S8
MYNYTLSDFIGRLNVAKRKHMKSIIIKPSKIVFSLLKIFEDMGIIRGYYMLETDEIEVLLRYVESKCAFRHLVVVSKPSRRIYVDMLNFHKTKELYAGSFLILSTSKGFMLDINCVKERQFGEVLLRIIM